MRITTSIRDVTAVSLGLACLAGPAPANAAVIGAGCGENGPTKSQAKPTVWLPGSVTLGRSTGDVRIRLSDANQTAGAIVRLILPGGRSVGGTEPGTYTCTDASVGARTAAVPLNDDGRRLMRRRGSLRVTLRVRLTNGSGVTNTIERSAVIRRER